MLETIIYFNWNGFEKPVVKVVDNGWDQVVLNFLSYKQEHLTLHLQEDATILRNHWDKDKPKRSWDDERVEVARKLGYANPEKHGKYHVHNPVGSISDATPSHLVGKRISFNNAPEDKKKYKRLNKVAGSMPLETAMANFYLYPVTVFQDSPLFIPTSLGGIIIKFED